MISMMTEFCATSKASPYPKSWWHHAAKISGYFAFNGITNVTEPTLVHRNQNDGGVSEEVQRIAKETACSACGGEGRK
jgi:hypothetical protein